MGNMISLIPTMTSNTSPSGEATASTFATGRDAYFAFDNSNSTWWSTTTNLKTGWLAYKFNNITKIDGYIIDVNIGTIIGNDRAPKDWTFEGSNDGNDWTVLDTQTNITSAVWQSSLPKKVFKLANRSEYSNYRINVTDSGGGSYLGIVGLELYLEQFNKFLILSNDNETISFKKGNISGNLVPEMTSNVAPSGVVEASSSNSTYLPFNAFNSSTTSVWLTNVSTTGWISYQFTEAKNIKKYSLRGSTVTRLPKDWTFEGWNGNSWEVLDTKTNVTNWQVNVFNEFTISNDKYYSKYRLNVSSNNGDANYLTLNGFMMFESADDELIILNSNSQDNFITHGMDKSTEIDLNSQITKKVFIEQTPTTLGSGKVFSKSINLMETPIKKATIK